MSMPSEIVVDPGEIDPTGKTTIDWFEPSPDGKLLAVSLSRAGTESGDVHLFDTATGEQRFEVVPRVNGGTAGGDLAWAADGSGFFYTRYPRGEERPAEDMNFFQQVYYHELATPTDRDRFELGHDLPRIAEIQLEVDHSTGRLLATVQDGDGGEFAHYLRSNDGKWKQFSKFGDRVVQAVFGPDDDLYIVSRHKAPRGKILRLDGATLDHLQAKTVIDQGQDSIISSFWGSQSVVFHGDRLYVLYQLGGPSEIRVFDSRGNRLEAPTQLPVSSVGGLTAMDSRQMLFRNESYTQVEAWYRFDPVSGHTEKTGLVQGSAVDLSDIRVVREMATSRDGTKVPVNIFLPPGADAGKPSACIVTGYGGYGISNAPRFRALDKAVLEQGVIYAVANLRGGGEFGEAWHRGGNLTNKQNVFDDFAGVLEHMIERGYTTSDRLGIIGGSNGGLLMGATLTQHPRLMRAVVTKVGIYDMLRFELSPNGAFNVTEFGSVTDRDQFEAMHAYSPYHHVTDGTEYPAVLFTTGANDPRVEPMHSFKMTARLQAAAPASTPILLRTNADAGHGADASLNARIDEETAVLSFFFDRLGVRIETE